MRDSQYRQRSLLRVRFAAVVAASGLVLAVSAGATDLQLAIGNFVGGGGHSTDGELALIGTIGDPAAGTASGGTLVLSGGVLAGTGDPSLVFKDGFESGFDANWSSSQSGGSQ